MVDLTIALENRPGALAECTVDHDRGTGRHVPDENAS